jgi:tetratricopeptide (TPR) repeat protein
MTEPTQQPEPSPEEMQPFVITMPDDPASGKDWYLWAAVLGLIALVAFWPAINGTFLWDDDQYVTQNKALQDASGLKEIWKIPPGTIQYYPLTFTALWVEHQIWGNNSLGYRVVNLLTHAGAAVVLWRLLRRLSIPGAWAAAAIWAVHPLQAESVCWISEYKNVLSGLLAIGSALFYLAFAGLRDPDSNHRVWNLREDWQAYLISVGLFLLAMLAKTAVVFLPVAVLAVLWWKRRLSVWRILGAAPMLIIGAALAMETARLETDPNGAVGASGPDWQLTFVQRLLIAGRDVWFYVGKLLLPIHQSFVYPRIVPDAGDAGQWAYLIAAGIVLIVLAAGVRVFGRGPLAAAICYLSLLFPALGFFDAYPFRFSFVADHFQYLAGIPLIVLFVSIIARILGPLWNRRAAPGQQTAPGSSAAVAALASMLLVVLGSTAWIRADVFTVPSRLWEDVLQDDKNPQSWLAAHNLAKIRQSEAGAAFDDADRLFTGGDPDSSELSAKNALRLLDDSDRLLKLVLENPATPDDVRYKAHDQWAENDITRMRSPDSDSSVILEHASKELKTAMEFSAAGKDPLPYYTLGIVDWNRGQEIHKQLASTSPTGEAPATTRPNTAGEQRFVDVCLEARQEFEKSAQLAEAGLKSRTVGPEAARVLPLAVYQCGNIDWTLAQFSREHGDVNSENEYSRDAATDYARTVSLNPGNKEARFRLALLMETAGDLVGAKQQLMIILRDLDHRYAPAYNEIGRVILASKPTDMADFDAAVQSFKDAFEIDPSLTGAQKNLELALQMKASMRPTTRSTTQPATMP